MLDDTERWVVQQVKGHAGAYVFIVLVASFKIFRMCSQVGVDNAETSVVKNKPHCHTTFVPLQNKQMNKILQHQAASKDYN